MDGKYLEKRPKVFISYSWSSDEKATYIANELRHKGIDAVFDKWDLEPGDDMYRFMERTVSDKEIDRVLILCDKQYKEKADSRTSGAGAETVIMTPEIYKQVSEEYGINKFIPIILEKDESGQSYVPVYLKSMIYIDLSSNIDDEDFDENIIKLIRLIYRKPENKKPPLGPIPELISNDDDTNLHIIKNYRKIKNYKKFIDEFIIAFKNYYKYYDNKNPGSIIKLLDMLLEIRNIYLGYLEHLILEVENVSTSDMIPEFFEKFYNNCMKINFDRGNSGDLEYVEFFVWESFICTVAMLTHYEKYQEINDILNHTYFLDTSIFNSSSNIGAYNFIKFRSVFRQIETYKKTTEEPNLFSLAAHTLVSRTKLPIITKQTIIDADILLYQLSDVYSIQQHSFGWFPLTYVYNEKFHNWAKLKSTKQCKKLYPLFGVNSIESLKEKVQLNKSNSIRYPMSFNDAPTILESVTINDIGILP